ncbi:MAG: hypothetical protein EZS28_047133 [Streblomastix strix]|uniref:Uncharacterized protein n=1 Tax=Streblomastix strix TaxID=222440 RepID=A0A5J4TIH8_9EUKA|nr:MAG: hypothetical protein EZS28_047133 [Streblomastix strix]
MDRGKFASGGGSSIYRSTKGTQYLPCVHTCFNQIDQPDAELEEDFEESQYGSSVDSNYRKPKYQLIKEKDDEIMGRGQGGEKYDWGIDWEGYDVCEEDETLLKIDVDITIPPIIARAADIPGTQEIVPLPPLWSAKVYSQREKDIQIELLDNVKKMCEY